MTDLQDYLTAGAIIIAGINGFWAYWWKKHCRAMNKLCCQLILGMIKNKQASMPQEDKAFLEDYLRNYHREEP